LRRFQQAVAILGGPGPPAYPEGQFGVARAHPRGFGAAKRLSQNGLVVELLGRRGDCSARPGPALLARRGPRARLAIAGVGPSRRHRFAQQPDPIERQVGMRVFERLTHFSVEQLAAHLEVWR